MFSQSGRGADAGAQFALVVAAGEVVDLTGSLEVDLLALVLIGEDQPGGFGKSPATHILTL